VPPSVVIITGVTGSGKTTVGRALAARVGWRFHDADDLHSPENIERMRRGVPLTDALRQPWLSRVREVIEQAIGTGEHAVIACSALKAAYRRTLAEGLPGVRFVLLAASASVLRERLAERQGHFAGAALLESQLAALEPPRDALTLDATQPVETLVDRIASELGL